MLGVEFVNQESDPKKPSLLVKDIKGSVTSTWPLAEANLRKDLSYCIKSQDKEKRKRSEKNSHDGEVDCRGG